MRGVFVISFLFLNFFTVFIPILIFAFSILEINPQESNLYLRSCPRFKTLMRWNEGGFGFGIILLLLLLIISNLYYYTIIINIFKKSKNNIDINIINNIFKKYYYIININNNIILGQVRIRSGTCRFTKIIGGGKWFNSNLLIVQLMHHVSIALLSIDNYCTQQFSSIRCNQ